MDRAVRFANSTDVADILIIATASLFSNRKSKMPEQTGFLMHALTEEYVRQAIQDKEHYIVLVAVEDEQVVGYTIAYQLLHEKPQWAADVATSAEIKNRLAMERILYHRHIAVNPYAKGAGSLLLERVLDEARKQNYVAVFCQIAQEPVQNKVSMALHEKFGFASVGDVERDGVKYGLYWTEVKSKK